MSDEQSTDPFQELYDDAMLEFSMGDYDAAIDKFQTILKEKPEHFDAQLSLGMAHYRKEDFPKAIEEGLKAEKLKPHEQLVHTNLSLFYMRNGDKETAEKHGLQARISSWRGNMDAPTAADEGDPELQMAQPKAPPATPPPPAPEEFPDMPWKKKKPIGGK